MTSLGYRPKRLLRDALPGVVEWYNQHLAKPAQAHV